MKILQIIHSLGNGGAEKFLVELSNELAKTNEVKLCVVKPIQEWMLPPKKIAAAVELIELEFPKKYSLILFCKLFRLIKKNRPDVVHVHSGLLVFYIYVISRFYPKTLFLQTIHNTITPGYRKLFHYLRKLHFLNRHFVNVCISKSIFEQFRSAYAKLNFVHIDNGIANVSLTDKFEATKKEIASLKKDGHTKVFVAIGNYSDFKNFTLLAGVFKELEIKNVNAILVLIGGGEYGNKKNIAEVAAMKGNNTYQLGLKDNVPDYLYCADALVMSSTKEGMPLVVLEALCAGLPVISTPAGGVIDIISDGHNGYIAEDFSKEALLLKILQFIKLADADLEKMKKRNKNDFAEKYSLATCCQNYSALYKKNVK
jgi:L-malate glycosyltransferase